MSRESLGTKEWSLVHSEVASWAFNIEVLNFRKFPQVVFISEPKKADGFTQVNGLATK